MTQTCSSASDSIYVLKDELVVLSWDDDNNVDHNEATFLGNIANVTILLTHNPDDNTSTIRIRVPFQASKKDDPYLYVFINPSSIRSIKRHSREVALPEPVCKSSLGLLPHHDIVGLNLCLETPPTVVGPAQVSVLHPKGKLPGNILASLRSLSQATNINVFARQNEAFRAKLDGFCEVADRGELVACTKTYDFKSLYGGTGGACVKHLLEPFHFRPPQANPSAQAGSAGHLNKVNEKGTSIGAEAPPTAGPADHLDEVKDTGLGAEPPPAYERSTPPPRFPKVPTLKSLKRRISPSKETPTSKRPLTHSTKSPSHSPNTNITTLRLELDSLRRQLNWHTAATANTPTEDGFLLDRLDTFETRLSALEHHISSPPPQPSLEDLLPNFLPRILEYITPHVETQINNGIYGQVQEAVECAMEEYRDDVECRIHELKDDIELSVESRVESAVSAEIDEVVAAQLPEVVGGLLENARVSLQIPRC